ncbi:MAG: Gfo/Idh/MocA family oxidoreductase [Verrucomicrobiota bacterium]
MSPPDEIRWAQIGCGEVTEKKSGPAFDKVPHSHRVGVFGRDAARTRDYAARHGIAFAKTDVAALLAHPGVNAVYIATPPGSHLHFTRLAAAAGKAVYVEKPMARNVAECEEMIAVCRRAGVPLFVAYYRRALPKYLRVKALLDGGSVGRPLHVTVRYRCAPRPADLNPTTPPWRVQPEHAGPGGYFMDMASHQLDLLDWLFGPVRHAAGAARQTGAVYAATDTVTGHFTLGGGVAGVGAWCFVTDPAAACDETEIVGDAGILRYSTFDDAPVRLTAGARSEKFAHPFPEHVQQPLIASVVAALRGEGICPSTGDSALRTNRAVTALLGAMEV